MKKDRDIGLCSVEYIGCVLSTLSIQGDAGLLGGLAASPFFIYFPRKLFWPERPTTTASSQRFLNLFPDIPAG
jgi:hypothetical protein